MNKKRQNIFKIQKTLNLNLLDSLKTCPLLNVLKKKISENGIFRIFSGITTCIKYSQMNLLQLSQSYIRL